MAETSPITRKVKFSAMRGRISSLESDCIKHFEPQNPPFEKRDQIEKLKICGIKNEEICAICGLSRASSGQGDHVWERKGYLKDTGYCGIISGKWNRLPICNRRGCNSGRSYKKIILTNGIKKDIGRDELTENDHLLVKDGDKKAVNIVVGWKDYVKKRGAIIRYRLTKAQEDFIAKRKVEYIQAAISNEQRMSVFLAAGCRGDTNCLDR
jgi:hypothetical protein